MDDWSWKASLDEGESIDRKFMCLWYMMSSKINDKLSVEAISSAIETRPDPIIRKDAGNQNGHGIPGQSIVDNLPHKFFIKDANLRYVSVNHYLAQDLGLSIDDIIGKTDKDLFAKDVAKRHHAVDLEILSTGTTIEIEGCIQRNGLTVWEKTIKAPFRDESGAICGVLGMYQDITDRKLSEEKLREQADKIRSLVDTSHDWIWTVDLEANHTITNPSVHRILGYQPDELEGKLSFDLMHEEDRQMIESEFPRWISEKRGWQGLVIRWKHKNGNWRYLESNSTPVLDENDQVVGFRGIDRDITERIQAEEKLAKALLVERRRSSQIAGELELASSIQQALMAASAISMDGFEIAASWIPAREMSGDFYKVQTLDDDRLALWVGDVSAKGVPAGLLMVLINAYLHVEMFTSMVPANTLSQLNINVSEILSESEQFTTLFLGVIDSSTDILTYSDAGHGHALIYRHASRKIEKLSATSPPLGIESQLVAVQKEVGINPSDILVVYSDGITEATSPSGDFFGEQRLLEMIRRHGQHSTNDLHDAILKAVDDFQQESVLMDDQTLLVIRRSENTRSELMTNPDQVTSSPLQVWTKSLTSQTGVLQPLHEWVAIIGNQLNIRGDKSQFVNACQLGISELVTNVIKHAYRGEHGRITIQARKYKDRLEFEIQDKGLAYEATPVVTGDLPAIREGNFGLLITQSVMDEVIYTRTPEGVNCWRLVKNLGAAKKRTGLLS
jgi:PAS domain S-box-containing protein